MPTIRSAQVAEAGGPFSIVERQLPEPGRGQVRLTVEACGVCRSDSAFVNAAFPDVPFPLVPGHEIAGRIDAVGDDVEGWGAGERVAVGWFGGNCGICLACREGDFIHCERIQVPGWAYPGGYSEGRGRSRVRAGAHPRRDHRCRGGTHGLRRRGHVQRVAAQPGQAG